MSRAGKRHHASPDSAPKKGWVNPTEKPHLGEGQAKRITYRSKQPPRTKGWIHELADKLLRGEDAE